jgi:5'-nucleotidase
MKIFFTNDDGFDSPGLQVLAASLRRAGHEVLVVAPDSDRSGASQSFSIQRPIGLKKLDEHNYKCRGTPVDCVMLLTMGALKFDADLVLSGINAGANLGTDLSYSATAGAAREAALRNYKAIALSLAAWKDYLWEDSSKWVIQNLDFLVSLCAKDTYINVNMPNIKGMRFDGAYTFPSKRSYKDKVVFDDALDAEGYQNCSLVFGDILTHPEAGSDDDIVSKGLVSISKLYIHPVEIGKIKDKG